MNPTNQQPPAPPTTPSMDYLNQIAPKPPKPKLFSSALRTVITLGTAAVLIVIAVSIVVNIIASSQKTPLQHLAVRLESTKTIVDDAQSNLKSSTLRSLNSELNLFLANTNRNISGPLESAGITRDKIPDTIVAEESVAQMAETLENARLDGRYDRVYAIEMGSRLENTLILMQQIYSTTNNSEVKQFLDTTYDNLQPIQQSIADF